MFRTLFYSPLHRKSQLRLGRFGPGLLAATMLLGVDASAVTDRSLEYLDDARERLESNDVNAAIIQLRNAIQDDPENAQARALLGRLHLERGYVADAEKELSKAFETIKTDEVALHLGQALLALGRSADVLDVVSADAAKRDPSEDGVPWQMRLLRAEALINDGQLGAAEALLLPAIEAKPLAPIANLLTARLELLSDRFDQARQRLEVALAADPDSFPAWLLKAQINLSRGILNEAESAAREALERAPQSPQPQLVLAEVELRRGQPETALTMVDGILENDSNNLAGRFLRVNILAALERFEEADRAMRQIADPLREVPDALLISGVLKARTNQLAQAANLLGQYLIAVPDNRQARRLLANIQLEQKQTRSAVDTLRPLVRENSQDLVSLQMFSSAQLRSGDWQGARESFRRILRLSKAEAAGQARSFLTTLGPDGSIPDETTRALLLVLDDMRNARLDAAQERAQAIADAKPEDAAVKNLLGAIYMARNNNEAAQAEFEAALAIDPNLQGAIANLNRVDARQGRPEAIEVRLRKQLEIDPGNQATRLQLASLLNRQQQTEEAIQLLEDGRAQSADAIQLRMALGSAYLNTGREDDLAGVIEELAKAGRDGSNLQAFQAAANLQARLGDTAAAMSLLAEAEAAAPDDIPTKLALARLQFQAGDVKAAQATIERVRAIDPTHTIANNSMVDLYLAQEVGEEALRFAASLAEQDPVQAANLQAKTLIALEQTDSALAILEQVHKDTPSPLSARNLFMTKHRSGRKEEAADDLRAWLEANPDDAGNLELLSQSLIVSEDYAEAAAPLEQAMQLIPDNPQVLNNLAWLRHELDRPGAVDLARRAQELAPRSPEITDTLGWILVREGDVEQGLPLLREAHNGLPDNPDIRYHLAHALNENGNPAAARELLEPLANIDQPFMEKEEAKKLLEKLNAQ